MPFLTNMGLTLGRGGIRFHSIVYLVKTILLARRFRDLKKVNGGERVFRNESKFMVVVLL